MAKREITPAQIRSYQKYIKGTDEIRVRVPKGTKQLIQEHTKKTVETMQDFIIRSVMVTMIKDEKEQYTQIKNYSDLLKKRLMDE